MPQRTRHCGRTFGSTLQRVDLRTETRDFPARRLPVDDLSLPCPGEFRFCISKRHGRRFEVTGGQGLLHLANARAST